jgi:hypothetical protein
MADNHHQPILFPLLEHQAFLMQAQCGLIGAKDCKCIREQRLNVPSEARKNSR